MSVWFGGANLQRGRDGGVERNGFVDMSFSALGKENGCWVGVCEWRRESWGFVIVGHCGSGE